MNREQFAMIAAGLQTAFPWANLFPTSEAMTIWFKKLRDIPYEVMSAVVNRWIDTRSSPPSIADLRAEADIVVNGVPPSWADGWEQVQKAIGRYGYMQREAALSSMDEVTRETVQRIGWQQICESENVDALRANFRMVHETMSRRLQEGRLISAGTQERLNAVRATDLIGSLADKMKLPSPGGKEEKDVICSKPQEAEPPLPEDSLQRESATPDEDGVQTAPEQQSVSERQAE